MRERGRIAPCLCVRQPEPWCQRFRRRRVLMRSRQRSKSIRRELVRGSNKTTWGWPVRGPLAIVRKITSYLIS